MNWKCIVCAEAYHHTADRVDDDGHGTLTGIVSGRQDVHFLCPKHFTAVLDFIDRLQEDRAQTLDLWPEVEEVVP